jgi:hypothetical protein
MVGQSTEVAGFAVARLTQALGGGSRGWSERDRSEVVALVREVVRVTAVRPANCSVGYGRAWRKSWSVRARPQ